MLRWLHRIHNQRMYGLTGEIYAPTCRWHGPLMRELVGPAAVMQQTLRLDGMISDGVFVAQHICSTSTEAGGVKVAVRWVIDGHHLGYGSLGAPTGHALSVMGFTHLHIVGDRIVEEWVVFDEFALMVQLKLAALAAAA